METRQSTKAPLPNTRSFEADFDNDRKSPLLIKKQIRFAIILIGIFFQSALGQTELITNGSFASGSTGWTLSGNFYADSRFSSCRSSPGYAYLSNSDGSAGNNLNGSMYQAVAVPASASSATLTFWYYITTQETGTTAYDGLDVTIENSSGGYLSTVAVLSNLNHGTSYSQISYDVSAYKGQTMRVNFFGTTDASLPTTFRIDDVSMLVTILNPTLSVSPSSVMQNSGNSFSFSGSGYTPNGTVNQYIEYSGQSSFSYLGYVYANSSGIVSWQFSPQCSTPVGAHQLYVVDQTSGKQSNTVNEVVTANASCAPSVTVTSPNGGENWIVGSVHNITATISGTITGKQIDYSTDGGSTWNFVWGVSTADVSLSFSWTVPNTPSTSCRVRVTVLYSGGSVADLSNANFTVSQLSGFSVGNRVMAGAAGAAAANTDANVLPHPSINVRDALGNVLFPQPVGVHGTIVAGPTANPGFTGNGWQIHWDSEPPDQNANDGWSAESVISLAPTAGDVGQPNFSNGYYTTNNPFFPSYAPNSIGGTIGTLGNCTWYAYGRMFELGYSQSLLNEFALHDASTWARNAAAVVGVQVDMTPEVGSIAQLDSGNFSSKGHGAVVESMNADGTITVTESSYSTSDSSVYNYLWHHRTVAPAWFSHFIHVAKSLPVELSSFIASYTESGALLKWGTQTEVNNFGFELDRRTITDSTAQWNKRGFVVGAGTSNSPHEYSFTDHDLVPGLYAYRIKQIDRDGSFKLVGTVEVEILAPSSFELEQNYPNPFNPSTTIRYQIPVSSKVILRIYNVLGQEMATLVNEQKESGHYSVIWNALNIPSGVYFYRMQAGSFTQTKRILLLR
jgi:surface antigen